MARAAKQTKPQKAKVIGVDGDGVTYPGALFNGEAPDKGAALTIENSNGTIYTGVVSDVVEVDGEVFVEFRDGLTHLK